MKNEDKCCEHKNPFVKIASVIGGISLVMILFIVIFAKEESWTIIFVLGFMTLLGIMLGHYNLLSMQKSAERKR